MFVGNLFQISISAG